MGITKIIHWFIPNISPGYASFLMSTNGLIHTFVKKGIDINISYEKHPIKYIMNNVNVNEYNINSTINYFEKCIHIIRNESQLDKLFQVINQSIIHICCVYCYEELNFNNIAYQCYLQTIGLQLKDIYYNEFIDILKNTNLYDKSFVVIHIRIHDKYLKKDYEIPLRKIKYIDHSIRELLKIIDTSTKILLISNSIYIKNYMHKKYLFNIITSNTIIQHSSSIDKYYQHALINNTTNNNIESIKYTLYEFLSISQAKKVYSVPLIYTKKHNILHGGNFSSFACQLFNKPYILPNCLSIYSIYHDTETESMESLEN